VIKIKESFDDKSKTYNKYYVFDEQIYEKELFGDQYRNEMGNHWDLDGEKQLNMLIDNGLKKDMNFLEIGCGYMRAGSHIINFLDPFKYYGIDVNKKSLIIGVNNELYKKGLIDKITENNFLATDNFHINNFDIKFDMALANSVFTFLPIEKLKMFLKDSYNSFNEKSKIIISFWIVEDSFDTSKPFEFSEENYFSRTTYYNRPPYYTKISDIEKSCDGLWKFKQINVFRYQLGQSFFLFERL
jgi:SAM-dependent methyltransferase